MKLLTKNEFKNLTSNSQAEYLNQFDTMTKVISETPEEVVWYDTDELNQLGCNAEEITNFIEYGDFLNNLKGSDFYHNVFQNENSI